VDVEDVARDVKLPISFPSAARRVRARPRAQSETRVGSKGIAKEDELELSMMEELARAPSFASIIIMWADRSRCVEQLLPLALHPRPVCCGAGA